MPCDLEELKKIYAETFRHLNPDEKIPEFDVRFYPYIHVKTTIRPRNGKIFVRIGEICREMSVEQQKALAFILLSKSAKKKVPSEMQKIYSDFGNTPEIRAKALGNKRAKGRKTITTAKGEIYDLNIIFDTMNLVYFDNAVPKPVLTWSPRKTYRMLGHYDEAHDTIVISRSLDRKKVPREVVDYVVFHEMLHILYPTALRNGRRRIHPPAFKQREKEYGYFDYANTWIEKNLGKLKRYAKGRSFF